MKKLPHIIAFYLPQFYPIKENDVWWGKGFTEWTNVGKAKPLFKGHNQPRVPTELGYYDLRLPTIRDQQVDLAREAGVTAFCYWHYWFGNGVRLLKDVFEEVLLTGKPEFPFCLGWANHSWYAKNWNSDAGVNKLLIEQSYPGLEDELAHFQFLLKAFKDDRYVKIEGSPLLYIFDPVNIPKTYLDNFTKWTIEEGFPGLYLVANITSPAIKRDSLLKKGFTAVSYQRLTGATFGKLNSSGRIGRGLFKISRNIKSFFTKQPPLISDYRTAYHNLITEEDKREDVIPTLIPQWDHTPRSGWNGSLFINATPDYFYKHALEGLEAIKMKSSNHKILFLKSWNEWGEGNYMEPDLKYGRGFILALKKALDDFVE